MTEDHDGPDAGPPLKSLYAGSLRRAQLRASRWLGHEAREIVPGRHQWRRDLLAGLPGAISSVPDGMASSVLAGVGPAHGLYASFAGPIVGGFTSSTRLMVVTTTSAAALAAGSALSGYDGAQRSHAMLLLTLIAGGVMLVAALLRLSRYIRFVSYSVMLGFLTGVSVNMVLSQLPDLVGVDAHGPFAAAKTWNLLTRLDEVNGPSLAAGALALAVLVALAPTRFAVASSLVALAIPTTLVLVFSATSVTTVQDGGRIPHGLPTPRLPEFALLSPGLVAGGFAIAALVLVQGAGVAEAVPNTDGSPSSMRRDFVAQGLANVVSSIFRGQPVGGSVGQTALNVSAGAVSRWASIWSGVWMLLILLLFSNIVGQVAMPTLAAVLIYAGAGSVHPREVLTVARAGAIPAVAMTATFVAVLLLPVAEAVGIGVIASLALQLRQEALDLRVVRLQRDEKGRLVESKVPSTLGGGEVVVLDAYGSLFYAGVRTLEGHLPRPAERGAGAAAGSVVVLRLRGRTTLGATFLKMIGAYAQSLEDAGARLYLSGVDPRLVERWTSDGTFQRLSGIRIEPATPILGESTHAALRAAHADGPGHGSRETGDA